MTIRLSAFRWVPDFARGHVKDLRVRWALEEAGLPYEQVLIGPDDQSAEAYRRWQPFGQVPAYRDDTVELFESGAIVLHIAKQSEVLAPHDERGRTRVSAWVFAALSSIEPQVQNVVALDLFHAGESWAEARRPSALSALTSRLDALAEWLGDGDYLEERFTAGDLVMTTVLGDLDNENGGVLGSFPTLEAYRRRCEARPAFERALDAQLQVFRDADAKSDDPFASTTG